MDNNTNTHISNTETGRIVGDRIMTEDRYQTELLLGNLLSVAPLSIGIVAGLAMFVWMISQSYAGWHSSFEAFISLFISALISFVVGYAALILFLPALLVGALAVLFHFTDKIFF